MANYDPFAPNADRSTPVNTPTTVDGSVVLLPYDLKWAEMDQSEAARIRKALREKACVLEHIGSTAVPGLSAKPCIDIVLGVEDSADEDAYVPQLDAAGFVLRLRHPDWSEHRLFKSERINVNLHVWSAGSSEIDRHVDFRNWLRAHPEDREAYNEAKQRIAAGEFATMPDYADAKNAIVQEIQSRIDAAHDTSG